MSYNHKFMNMRRLLLFSIFVLFSTTISLAQHSHARLRIDLQNHSLREVAALGLETDHGLVVPGQYIVNDFSDQEIQQLDRAGIPYEVLIPEVGQWYADQQPGLSFRNESCGEGETSFPFSTPANYNPGSMGGYFTYEEMLEELAAMAELYPELITPIQPIDTFLSHEGRPVYWLKVSDNPQQDEAEPEILYTALHHAREPNSLSQMIFYLWYLLENYESDPMVQALVNASELYFVPCINPDGYIHNQTIAPNGGGMWRKNRRIVDGSPQGVDLNRNYAYEWGSDNVGSSPSPDQQDYRGTAPFSEPESQAIRYFAEQHAFQIALNYHTWGNLLLHPWGYSELLTEEDALFKAMGSSMTEQNGYLFGNALETVGYFANGNSDDWMYGEQTSKSKIYSFTPEVGNMGFWPVASAIDGQNKACMHQNLRALQLLHYHLEVVEEGPERLLAASDMLSISLQRTGLGEGSATVTVNPASTNVSVNASPATLSLEQLEAADYEFGYTVLPGTALLEPVAFEVVIDNGIYTLRDTLQKTFQNAGAETLFADGSGDLDAWFTGAGDWGLTDEYFVSPSTSFTDSPGTEYAENTENALTLQQPVLLTGGAQYLLQFSARWELEQNFDYLQIRVSEDLNNWTPLCGQYAIQGNGFFQPGEPVYNGIQEEWVKEEIDLTEYAGKSLFIQFVLRSDGFIELDGFYFDDLKVVALDSLSINAADDIAPLAHFRAYPNPVREQLYLELQPQQAIGRLDIQLFNSLGQAVKSQTLQDLAAQQLWTAQWPVAGLPDGIYFLQVRGDGKLLKSQRIVR